MSVLAILDNVTATSVPLKPPSIPHKLDASLFLFSSVCDDSQLNSFAIMSAPVIPAGKTWLDTLKKSFVDVSVDAANDNAVSTTDFLEAAESFTTLFGS